MTIRRRTTNFFALAAVAMANLFLAATTVSAAPIDSVSINSGTLESITVGSTTYGVLTSPSSFVDNKSPSDWLHISGTAPATTTLNIGSTAKTKSSRRPDSRQRESGRFFYGVSPFWKICQTVL